MLHKFVVEVSTNYPHRFIDEPPVAIYDREGYMIGTVTDIREGDFMDIGNEAIREQEDH